METRGATVSDYIVYIVYICTLAEKVWTERRYLSDNVDAQQRTMKRLNFITLLPPCLLQSLAVGFSTSFLTKEN